MKRDLIILSSVRQRQKALEGVYMTMSHMTACIRQHNEVTSGYKAAQHDAQARFDRLGPMPLSRTPLTLINRLVLVRDVGKGSEVT